ncbi:hypothetical protein [Empedobacter falsenii]|uniref:hypothetical protein n=1 Tax=Empedobacter falsenii TaxID=343874 RepID=UPI001C8F16DB|nr:hypothetical protein [Empedobacter falsenii]MBY0067565.1 hypothetical protein [Empedobacter falsenii]
MKRATINLRLAQSKDFKQESIDYNNMRKMVIRENFPFFIYLKEFDCYDGPILMNKNLDIDLFRKYLEANLIYVFESVDHEILYGDLGLEKEEPQTDIAC